MSAVDLAYSMSGGALADTRFSSCVSLETSNHITDSQTRVGITTFRNLNSISK